MHVPDAIGNRVYKMFASPTAAKQEEGTKSATDGTNVNRGANIRGSSTANSANQSASTGGLNQSSS